MSVNVIFISFFFNAIFSFRTTRPAEYGCQAGWVHEPSGGYCYRYNSALWVTWQDARTHCIGLGADLTSIHSQEENDFIFDFITGFVWIGITDEEEEGVFTTFSDGTPVTFQNWAEKSYQTDHRDCAALKHDPNNWFWFSCTTSTLRSVCKKVHQLVTTTVPITNTLPIGVYGCEAGWFHESSRGYCYLFIENLWLTWADARTHCLGLGADLTSIQGIWENDLIFDLITGFAWIGITDEEEEGVFTTFTDGTPVTFQNWAVDDFQNDSRDCVVIRHDQNKFWFWYPCTSALRSVCKKDHQLIIPTTTIVPTTTPTTQILCPTHVYINKQVWCALLIDTFVEHSNYTFCFEDSEDTCSVAKPKSWSLDDLPDALKDSAASMTGFLASFHNYTYTVVGSYELTAVVNQTLAVEVTLTVKRSCINRLSIDVKRHCDAPYPDVYLGALDIDISACIVLDKNCIDPITSEFSWWIYTSSEDGDVTTAFERITHIPHLTIPRRTIAYGNYSLKLKAETHRKTSDELTDEEEVSIWLEIQPSPLVAVIQGGASRSHGLGSNLIVDGSTSYDPDVTQGSSSDLTFSWYCVLVHSDIMYASLEEVMEITDDACFKEEGIMMSSSSSKLEFASSNLMANVTMNFWLLVSKEGKISGSTQQRIQVTVGLWPHIEISCISNCNKYIFSSERLILHALCNNCDSRSEDVSFLWSVESNHSSLIDDLSSWTNTGLDQPYLVIKPHTFDSVSEGGNVVLRATGYLRNSVIFGYAEFSATVTAPPALGCCVVTPKEGYALQTYFTLQCYDFSNVDEPLTYELILFNRVDVVDGNLVGLGEGFQIYEGSKPLKDGLIFPVGDGDYDHTLLLQVNVRNCYMATTSVFVTAIVRPSAVDVAGENMMQEFLEMTSSRVNKLLTVGDAGQAASLISALVSILNSIYDENEAEGRDTRKEIRSSLVDSVAAIPLESLASLRQSSSALAAITHNKQEISMDLQMKTVSMLAQMTSYLKAESSSYSQDQKTIESAGTILVEGLSNILSAAEETERQLSTNTSQDREEYKASVKNLTKVVLSAINEIQDAIAHGKVPGEETTVITSPTLSIAVSSISKDNLAGATFEGSDDDGLGSFGMPSTDGGLDDIVNSVNEATLRIQMTALKWNPFTWGAGGESLNSSIVGIKLIADHSTLEVQDLSADISVYLPMKGPLSRDPASAHVGEDFSAFLFVNHSLVPEDGAIYLKVTAENEPFAALSICTADISIDENATCLENFTVVSVSNEAYDTAANFTWSVSAADLKGADGILISLYDGKDQPVYGNEKISLSIFIYTSQCIFWNEDQQEWDSTGCKVGPLSKPTATLCLCDHLTFFGSSLSITPTKIIILKDDQLIDKHVALKFVGYILLRYVLYCIVLFICIVCYVFLKKILESGRLQV